MFGHSALKPKEVGLVRLQPILVISENQEHKDFAESFINTEFDDYLYTVQIETLEGHEKMEGYKIHILKIDENKAELTFKSGQKILQEFDDLEQLLEKFGRELISYYHESMR